MIYIKALQKVHSELIELSINKVDKQRVSIDFDISLTYPSVSVWIFGLELENDINYAMAQSCTYFEHQRLGYNLKNVADFKQHAENLINTYLKG